MHARLPAHRQQLPQVLRVAQLVALTSAWDLSAQANMVLVVAACRTGAVLLAAGHTSHLVMQKMQPELLR